MSDAPKLVRNGESRDNAIAQAVSTLIAVVLLLIVLGFASRAIDSSIIRSVLQLSVQFTLVLAVLYGLPQLSRHEQPPTMQRKWFDLRFGLAVVVVGVGLLMRDLLPSLAILLAHIRASRKSDEKPTGSSDPAHPASPPGDFPPTPDGAAAAVTK